VVDSYRRIRNTLRFLMANVSDFDPATDTVPDDQLLEIDALNGHVAGRMARAMDRWASLAEPYRSAAREAIARVAAKPDLSSDVREVVSRALEQT
jgi:aminopeptidase N